MGKALLFLLALHYGFIIFAQTSGNEDKEMFNLGKQRDQLAIDEAKNGWWAASMKTQERRIQWWREAKFGMFIHWGVYSLPGGEWKGKKINGYAEHLMRKEKISRKEYLELAHRFNPVQFNAEEWILHAKKAGMKYFIITAKHHDGFAMYASRFSDFDIRDQTPFQKDPMAELAAAAKKHGIKFGFYYSHAFDWEHPDAPGNDWEYRNPGGDLNLFDGRNWYDLHPELLPSAQRYVNEKAIPQIRELLTRYDPDILWFDTPHKLPLSENIRILKAIRETDPDVVVNGRLVRHAAANFGDYKNTADRPAEFYPVIGDWEAIPTTNESYGYHQFDNSHKPVSHFIQLLANAASRGGNLLMNIGPKGDGTFDAKDLSILKGIGKWLVVNGESIYGTSASPLPLQNWGVSTLKGNKMYLHVFQYPERGKLYVGGLKTNSNKVYLLQQPAQLLRANNIDQNQLVIELPLTAPDTINTVVVVELENKIAADTIAYYLAPGVFQSRLLAFDAQLKGKGFSYGDGKTNRYYVEGWKSNEQSVTWKFYVAENLDYRASISYICNANSGGTAKIIVDGREETELLIVSGKNDAQQIQMLPEAFLAKGIHSIEIKPVKINGEELMKLLELQLNRIDKAKLIR